MTLKFIPPKKIGNYALYVESGYVNHTFKVYNDLGSLKNAFYSRTGISYRSSGTSSNAKILEMVNGEWYTLFDVPANTKYEDLPWIETSYRVYKYGYWINASKDDETARKVVKSVPMSREKYAEWRIRVELERRGIEDVQPI